jgi:hypothetical protein
LNFRTLTESTSPGLRFFASAIFTIASSWVERGEKSISIDSLYKVSVALAVPMGHLTNVQRSRRAAVPSEAAQKIFALISDRHPTAKLRRAYNMLRKILDGA